MNYLAHAYLSGEDEELLVGNFIADAVKGKNFKGYLPGIKRGIELHRAIDYFTDTHPVNKESRLRLVPKYRHYSSVVVDLYYDHFLAANWEKYHSMNLENYTQKVYFILKKYNSSLPEHVKMMLSFMVPQDWLLQYASVKGIGKALSGLSHRTKFESKMDEAVHELTQDYDLFLNEFLIFFPLLQKFVHNYLET